MRTISHNMRTLFMTLALEFSLFEASQAKRHSGRPFQKDTSFSWAFEEERQGTEFIIEQNREITF